MLLKVAADYVKTGKATAGLLSLLMAVKRIFTFTQERDNRVSRCVAVTRAYAAGQSVKEIEDKFGCSKSTVLRYARAAEIPTRPKHLPAEIARSVLIDYKAGIPIKTIAMLHGVSQAYVSTLAKKHGIKRYGKRQ